MKKTQHGFSLVELSIVILITALITVGVISGRTILFHSKVVAQVSDLTRYQLAYKTFKEQFNAVPGDMRNASAYWNGVPDGNGDGYISHAVDNAYITSNENIKFFQHLSAAKLIPERFENVWAINIGYPSLKINPEFGMVAGGFIATNAVPTQYQLSVENILKRYNALLVMEVTRPDLHSVYHNDYQGTGSAKTYYAVDMKIDDGLAVKGLFKAYRAWDLQRGNINGNCLDGIDGQYDLTNHDPACHAIYVME
ncbi:MAG: hypothetical protein COV35_03885 [Alphaproteobacteria bacterium CG11_big_fil_rev_8_21_14_0_20_39_49]|nr:MAG: hypothetical protein COV35_03885 [Alphaproteobacteria bacterium CG11_big_fil_rev_8_21_14_0_20_39_49]